MEQTNTLENHGPSKKEMFSFENEIKVKMRGNNCTCLRTVTSKAGLRPLGIS